MTDLKLEAEDVERLAQSLGISIKSENSATIASMLSEMRQNIYIKASTLEQDAPLSVYFDAR